MSYCDCCEHFGVCKYQEEFEKFKKELPETETDVFKIEVKCKKYSSKAPYIKGPYITNVNDYSYTIKTTSKNLCEDCSVYKDMKNGKIYVGDSPCQWCTNGGLRVTCASSSLTAREENGETK